jgi:hypothetical protein
VRTTTCMDVWAEDLAIEADVTPPALEAASNARKTRDLVWNVSIHLHTNNPPLHIYADVSEGHGHAIYECIEYR